MPHTQLMPFGLDDAPSTGVVQYQSITGQGEVALWNGTESEVRVVISTPGVFTNLTVLGSTSPGTSKSYTITLRVNGVDSALAAVLSGTNTRALSRERVSVNASDVLTLQSTPAGSPAAVIFRGCLEFEPENPGVCVLVGGTGDVALGIGPGYLCPHALANRSSVEDQVYTIIPDIRGIGFGTITNFYVELTNAPLSSASRTFEIYLNGVGTGELVTISGTNRTGNASVSVGLSDGDTLSIYATGTSSPAGSTAYYGMEISTSATGDYLICGVSGGAMSTTGSSYEYNFCSTGNAAWRTAKSERVNGAEWKHHILALALKTTRAPNTGGGSGKAYELYLENPSAGGVRAYVLDSATYDIGGPMAWGLKKFNNIDVREFSYGSPSVADGSWAMQMRHLP